MIFRRSLTHLLILSNQCFFDSVTVFMRIISNFANASSLLFDFVPVRIIRHPLDGFQDLTCNIIYLGSVEHISIKQYPHSSSILPLKPTLPNKGSTRAIQPFLVHKPQVTIIETLNSWQPITALASRCLLKLSNYSQKFYRSTKVERERIESVIAGFIRGDTGNLQSSLVHPPLPHQRSSLR